MSNFTFPVQLNATLPNCSSLVECVDTVPLSANDYFVEAARIFVFFPISVIGACLSLLSFAVLRRQEFNSRFFEFLRIYALNSFTINILDALFNTATWHFAALNQYYTMLFYADKIFLPLQSTGYFFGAAIDSVIVLERIKLVETKHVFLNQFPPKLIAISIYLTCLFINLPMFFNFNPKGHIVMFNSQPFEFYTTQVTEFATSRLGIIMAWTANVLRDVVTLVLEVCLNVYLLVAMRKFLRNKRSIMFHSARTNRVVIVTDPSSSATNSRANADLNKEKNLTTMVTVMCCFSSAVHLVILFGSIYYTFFLTSTAYSIYVLSVLMISIKHASTFFLFFFLNKQFKAKLVSFISKSN